MGEPLRDKQDRFVCQQCGINLARIWTFHRRTETGHFISYRDGQVHFEKLPKQDGIAAYLMDEYLCFNCCLNDPQSAALDSPADLEPGTPPEIRPPAERIEYEAGYDPSLEEEDELEDDEEFDDTDPSSDEADEGTTQAPS